MKIVYLSASLIPSRTANSIHVMKMCQAFAKNGHEVHLLASTGWSSEPDVDDPYRFYGVDPCFTIEKLPWIQIRGWIAVLSVLAALRAKILAPDLVYGRLLQGCFIAGLLGLPVVYEAHSIFPGRFSSRISAWIFSFLISSKRLKRLVVISGPLWRYYQQQYGISERLITVAPDAADPPRPSEPLRFAISNRLQVGYVGHLYPGRGLEIIAGLAECCPWADFHMIGGINSDVSYWRRELSVLGNVTVHGFVPPSKTDVYRQSFDVLLAPYQRSVAVHGGGNTAQWMSPLKVFEYMAAGKAILCSDLPVLREVLTHGETALLCEPEDVQVWVRALQRLRDDQALRIGLGQTAKREFEAKYTWDARADKVLKDYVK